MKGKRTTILLAVVLAFSLVAVLFLTGCDGDPEVTVGSKEFTEQLILSHLTLMALEDAGIPVRDRTNLGGTEVNRRALEEGEIDIYWEYTGTAWLAIFEEDEAITDPDRAYNLVKERDAEIGLVWLDYAPFDNTYTIMMRQEHADELGIETISELGEWIIEQQEKGHGVEFATDHEFMVREDGYPALQELYGFEFDRVHDMAIGLTHVALRDRDVDAAMGFATDGKIAELELVNLEDDRGFFPVYNPAGVVREEILEEYPEIADILGEIASRLDTETMIHLNYLVDVEGYEHDEAAEEWLLEQGLISE